MQQLGMTGWLLAALLLVLARPSPALPGKPDSVRELARDILADEAYQKNLVEPETVEFIPVARRSDGHGTLVLLVLLMLGLALAGALILLKVFNTMSERRREKAFADEENRRQPETPQKDPQLEEAEDHAAAGRFTEAVHLLLLIAVDRLHIAQGLVLSDALTSRELLRLLPRTPEERTLFKHLVTTVEVSLFGGRAVTGKRYRICLEACRSLMQ